MLVLVLSLGLVAFLMSRARDPGNWAWFFANSDVENGSPPTPVPFGDVPIEDVLQHQPQHEDMPGGSVSPARPEAEEESVDGHFPGVKPAYLDEVRDNTTFRPQEQDAWFHLFEILNKTDQTKLRSGSIGRVTYRQLYRQSDQYRGRLVTIRGTIRRANPVWVPKNAYGIEHYYRTWIQPVDERSSPMVVYCLYLPEGFPTGMDVTADVEITGFYFKRWGYRAKDSLRTAPTLLARSVDWRRPPPAAQRAPGGLGSVLTVIAAALCMSLLLAAYVYVRTRRARLPEPAVPPQFDALRDAEIVSGPRLPWETTDRHKPEA